jgi:HTH-type transcriptional regulator/antitoxin HigA
VEAIFEAPIDIHEGDEAEILSIFIEKYEDEHCPVGLPDSSAVIKFRMEQMGMNKSDLAKIIGYKSRVSEVFSSKGKLALQMIRRLHDTLKIPYESQVADY